MAACNITAVDVANAIRNQNLDAPAGWIGKPPAYASQAFELPINTLGRLNTPEQFGEIIVKAGMSAPPPSSAPPWRRREAISACRIPLPPGLPAAAATERRTGQRAAARRATPRAAPTPRRRATRQLEHRRPAAARHGRRRDHGRRRNLGRRRLDRRRWNDGRRGDGSAASDGRQPAPRPPSSGSNNGVTPDRGPGQPSFGVVRLRDVARIELGAQNYNQSCSFDGRPSVGLSVYQRPDTNALDVADAVRKKMEELKTRFPDGLAYDIGYDTTPFIRESVQDVVTTMLEAVALVGLVVLVFLQDWKAMILPMIDVPVSIIGTFAVMAAMDFSLNNISLFGLVLAIGIVVDDAIVVLENIERMLARGHDVRTATIKAMEEVTGPIIAVALVLCAVFVPCAFLSGITGQFFRQFALTISVSTVISAINAITMTPSRAVLLFKTEAGTTRPTNSAARPCRGGSSASRADCSRFGWGEHFWPVISACRAAAASPPAAALAVLDPDGRLLHSRRRGRRRLGWLVIGRVNRVLGWLFRKFNHYFDRMSSGYAFSVGGLLRVSIVVLVVYGGLLALTYWAFQRAPTGFIPQQDQGRLIANIQLPDSASLERTEAVVAKIERSRTGTPGIAHTVAFAGMSFLLQANSSNFASMFIVLDPFDQRQKPELRDTAIMNSLSKAWAEKVTEAQFTVLGASPIPGLGIAGGFKFIVEDRGDLGLVALQKQTDGLIRKTAEGPRPEPGDDAVPLQDAAALPRHRPRQGRIAGRVAGRREPDVGYLHGLAATSTVSTISAATGRSRSKPTEPIATAWKTSTCSRSATSSDRWSCWARWSTRGRLPARLPSRVITFTRRPPSAATSTPATARATPSRPSTDRGRNLAAFHEGRLDRAHVHAEAGGRHVDLRLLPGHRQRVPRLVGALRELVAAAGGHPGRALVPALFRGRRAVHAAGRQHLRADRPGRAGRAGVQECDPRGRVCQAVAPEGRSAFEATKEASRLRLRPILMTSFAFIFGVIPLMIASGAGAECAARWGSPSSAACSA